jgi:hypothetical protein
MFCSGNNQEMKRQKTMEDEPCANPGTKNEITDTQQMGGMENCQMSLPKCDSMVGTSYQKTT